MEAVVSGVPMVDVVGEQMLGLAAVSPVPAADIQVRRLENGRLVAVVPLDDEAVLASAGLDNRHDDPALFLRACRSWLCRVLGVGLVG